MALAQQGRCYVVSVGAARSEREDLPDSMAELYTDPKGDEGGSCVIGPDGKVIAQADGGDETIVCGEGSLEEIRHLKVWCDIGGHYARPDVTRLLLNTSPLNPVERFHTPFSEVAAPDPEPPGPGPVPASGHGGGADRDPYLLGPAGR